MKKFAEAENALVVRTDFSSDEKWEELKKMISTPVDDMQANVDFLDDAEYDGLQADQLKGLLEEESEHEFIFLVDKETMENSDQPVLCVDVFENPGDTFRVIPSQMWAVENNLSLMNMEYADFKNATDDQNVFRGF